MRLFPKTSTDRKGAIAAKLLRAWLGPHRYCFVVDDLAVTPSAPAGRSPRAGCLQNHEM